MRHLVLILLAGCGRGDDPAELAAARHLADCSWTDETLDADGALTARARGAYDGNGDLVSQESLDLETGEARSVWTAIYDAPHEVTEVRTSVVGSTNPDRVERWTWSDGLNIGWELDADDDGEADSTAIYAYDADRRIEAVEDTNGDGQTDSTSTYTWAETDAGWTVTGTQEHALGDVYALEDRYDTAGRLVYSSVTAEEGGYATELTVQGYGALEWAESSSTRTLDGYGTEMIAQDARTLDEQGRWLTAAWTSDTWLDGELVYQSASSGTRSWDCP